MNENNTILFLNWPEAWATGGEVVGGKGWNLGRLHRYGFNIPLGGVLSAETYQRFIKENRLLADITDIARLITIDAIGAKEAEWKLDLLREKIKAGRLSQYIETELTTKLKQMGILNKPLAIRSSATAEDSAQASFAGIHDSFLNVRGVNNILSAIKECYASLWTLRAVAYRRKMNINDDEVGQAVVIMEMMDSQSAGVGFSCDPRTGREDIMLISANFGLGESVVKGAMEPDEYYVDYWCDIVEKKTGRKEGITTIGQNGGIDFIKTCGLEGKQVLSDEQISRLGLLIQRIFDALGNGEQHQDIEWVFDGEEFAIVQARPVTVIPRYTFDEIKNQPDIWSNANFSDTMPMVLSTLNWSMYKRFFKLSDMFANQLLPGLQGIRLYEGRAYVNLSIQQWLMYDSFGLTPHQTNEAWGGHQPEIEINDENPFEGVKGLQRLERLQKLAAAADLARNNAQAAFDKVNLFTEGLLRENFSMMADRDLISKMEDIRINHSQYYPVFMACLAASDVNPFIQALERYFPGEGKVYANALMAGAGNITSAEQGYRLMELAQIAREDAAARKYMSSELFDPLCWQRELPEESPFKQALRIFLDEYGHRAVYELEIKNPRWREDPSYLFDVIKSTMKSDLLSQIRARQKEKADRAWQEVNQRVPYDARGTINSMLQNTLKGMELREQSKSTLVKLSESYRLVFQEVGRRLTNNGIIFEQTDVYNCSWSEITSILRGDWNGKGLNILVAERKKRNQQLEKLSPPDFIVDEVPNFTKTDAPVGGNIISGLGVAAGKASGAARLIHHPHQGERLQLGDVLVAPTTDPGWTPLFLKASAIVIETGGAGSHGAIVAREYGIPTVVNARSAMQIIKDGQNVVVDGDEGKVFLQ